MTTISGKAAELAAKRYLCGQQLAFIESNYTCRQGEIDLIMREGKQWVFIEVKYRKNCLFGYGYEHVTRQKQQRIIKAARHYLHIHRLTEKVSCRFDVVSVAPSVDRKNKTLSFNWFKDAFASY